MVWIASVCTWTPRRDFLNRTRPTLSEQPKSRPPKGLTVYSSGAFSLDEIRLGETFADVVPVPEPSAAWLLLLGSVLLLKVRKQS
jgi:hypothetical protein